MEILYLIITLLVGVAIGVTIENYRLLQIEKLTKPWVEMPTIKDTYDIVDVTATYNSPYIGENTHISKRALLYNMEKDLEPLVQLESQYDPQTMLTRHYGRLKVLRR